MAWQASKAWHKAHRQKMRAEDRCISCSAPALGYARCARCRAREASNLRARRVAAAVPLSNPAAYNSGRLCGVCHRQGHTAKCCVSQPCDLCGQTGHRYADCPFEPTR